MALELISLGLVWECEWGSKIRHCITEVVYQVMSKRGIIVFLNLPTTLMLIQPNMLLADCSYNPQVFFSTVVPQWGTPSFVLIQELVHPRCRTLQVSAEFITVCYTNSPAFLDCSKWQPYLSSNILTASSKLVLSN